MLRFSPRLGDVEGAPGTASAPAQHGSLSSARRGSAAAGRPAGEQPNPAATVDLGRIRRAMLVVICLSLGTVMMTSLQFLLPAPLGCASTG